MTFFFIYFSGNCPFPRLIIEADDQAPIYYNKKQINNRMTNQIWLIYYSGFRFHTFAPCVCICTVSVVVYIVVRLYYLWAFTNPLVAKVIYFQKRVDSLLSLSPMIFPIRYVFCVRVLYQLNFADRWTPPICQLFVKCYSPFHSKSLYYTGCIDKNWEFELWKMRISQYVSALLLG